MNKFVCFILICFLVLGFGIVARADLVDPNKLPNPLEADNFAELITGIVDWMITLGSMIAVAMVIWSGFLFMTVADNESKLSNAKKSLLWSLVGLGILLMSKTFILLIQEIVTASILKMLI